MIAFSGDYNDRSPSTIGQAMPRIDPQKARDFARDVVSRLRASGFESLWAGGCVRDQLLGCQPKDYDVATSATPDEIREVFGKRKTLPIGAAFGVITVLGPRPAGQIEVATFRRDATYSDGRHPDSVAFSNAEEDAKRRDFTINGLFYDPLSDEVIDYVGGEADLVSRKIRAIGDAEERLNEDKLRMLRAVRFATTLGFEIDPLTMVAIRHHAHEISVVSVERIATELRRLFASEHRQRGLELLGESGLLNEIFPEAATTGPMWDVLLRTIGKLRRPTFAVCIATVLRSLYDPEIATSRVEKVCRRLKLTNEEIDGVKLCVAYESIVRNSQSVDWPKLQRVLTNSRIEELLCYATAIAADNEQETASVEFCRDILLRPHEDWNPEPLITGDDLKRLEIPAGPAYRKLLTLVRDAQLNGDVSTRQDAIDLAMKTWQDDARD